MPTSQRPCDWILWPFYDAAEGLDQCWAEKRDEVRTKGQDQKIKVSVNEAEWESQKKNYPNIHYFARCLVVKLQRSCLWYSCCYWGPTDMVFSTSDIVTQFFFSFCLFLFVNIFEHLKNVHSLRCLRWPVQNNVNKINEKLVVHFLNKHKFCKHLQTSQQFVSASWTQALDNVDYVKMPKSRPKRPACLWFLQPDRDVNSGWVV